MKIKIKKRNLESALQVVTIAQGSGDESNLATHFLVRFNKTTGAASILAQDGRRLLAEAPLLECVVDSDADTEWDAFTVPGWRLRQWMSAVEDGDEELTLTSSDGVVKGTSKRGTGKFGSLNPKDWPYWDETLADAKLVARMGDAHLSNILSYTKSFVSDQETRSPAIVATECRDGVLHATDSVGVSLVKSPALKDSTLRVHGKDIPSILSFLGLKGSEEVEVKEHDRCVFFVRDDGSTLGVTRWIHQFPDLKNLSTDPNQPSKCSFAVNTADLTGAIKFLSAFAKKDDVHLYFKYENNRIILSMESGSGSAEEDEQVIPCVEQDGMDALKAEGYSKFTLSKRYVETVANTFGQDVIKFRVDVAKRNGYVSFFHERDGDDYFTVVVWLR